jgi:hypothetical protein
MHIQEMVMKRIITLSSMAVSLCLASIPAHARPVSYPGGWTAMQNNNQDMHSLLLHYSPTADYSIGYLAEYWREAQWQFHGVQVNYLAKRWNEAHSQANFYIKSGVGVAYSDYGAFSGHTQAAAFTGLALDWENRRYFTSYENRLYYAGDIDKFFMQQARVGIAPYIGDYGDWHSWIMLQVDHNPSRDDQVILTPLVRVFKNEYLAEFGVSDRGDVLFNWIARF